MTLLRAERVLPGPTTSRRTLNGAWIAALILHIALFLLLLLARDWWPHEPRPEAPPKVEVTIVPPPPAPAPPPPPPPPPPPKPEPQQPPEPPPPPPRVPQSSDAQATAPDRPPEQAKPEPVPARRPAPPVSRPAPPRPVPRPPAPTEPERPEDPEGAYQKSEPPPPPKRIESAELPAGAVQGFGIEAPGGGGDPAVENPYLRAVRDRIATQRGMLRSFFSPGNPVRARVSIELDRQGLVRRVEPSGSRVSPNLAHQINVMVTTVTPFPPPPASIPGNPVVLTLDVLLPGDPAAWSQFMGE